MFDERQKVFSEKKIPQDDLMLFCLSGLFRLLTKDFFGFRNFSIHCLKTISALGMIPFNDYKQILLSELFRLLPTNNFGLRNYSDCWQKSFSTFGIFPCEENK